MTATAESLHAAALGVDIALPAQLIQDGEEIVLSIKPSGFFVLLVSAPVLLALAMASMAAAAINGFDIIKLPTNAIVAACVAAGLLRLALAGLQWLSRIYVLTNRRILRIKGVLHVSVFECPLQRLQNTVLALSLAERIFGIGTILFATAGTGQMEAAWTMIAKPAEVHKLVVEYIRRAQNRGGPAGL
ncbi:MAG: PH domain-containing protein [Planctomycetes bacterium]|nr:PH domain-containing protein [Planctomycetota bacterium]